MKDIVLNAEQRELLKGGVEEMVNSYYRQQAEKDLQGEIVKRMKEDLELDTKIFRKLAKTAYEDSGKKQNDELTCILDLAEEIGVYTHDNEII